MKELAQVTNISEWLAQLSPAWDRFLQFEHPDALQNRNHWVSVLEQPLPEQGVGLEATLALLAKHIVPNGSAIPRPGCSSWITTGATNAALLARWSADLASPQRLGLTAFSLLEDQSLAWLQTLLGIAEQAQGQFTAGGASANLIALGAARQAAYEHLGEDVAEYGLSAPGVLFASSACHRTVHRAAAVLGFGRRAVQSIEVSQQGQMQVDRLALALRQARDQGVLPIAVVANAGATSTGAIDSIAAIADVCEEFKVWLHVDGAYGLPGKLDPDYEQQYVGLERANSVIVDPHKWFGAPVGIGAVFVKNAALLARSYSAGPSDYLEGSFTTENAQHSMDVPGSVPYNDFGIDLSAPARGVMVWAILKEIGVEGLRARVCRHNAMAKALGRAAEQHPNLELMMNVSLSICCFRYRPNINCDLNQFNRQLHRELVHRGINIPSTASVRGQLVLRPCFIGARADFKQVDDLLTDVLSIGERLEQVWSNE